ncbi:MAG: CARDB domain-containing protein, partial [Thermoplasmata archaeon]
VMPGTKVTFTAFIIDPNNDIDIEACILDLFDLNGYPLTENLRYVGLNTYAATILINESHLRGASKREVNLTVNSTDLTGNKSAPFNFTFIIGGNDIDVKITSVWFSPTTPKHGETVTIDIDLFNSGFKDAEILLEFYVNNISVPIQYGNFNGSTYVYSVSTRSLMFAWSSCGPGGLNTITFYANVTNGVDAYEPDNYYNTTLAINPTILYVDDTQEPEKSEYMRAAIDASGFEYDYTRVGANTRGPLYNGSNPRLNKYDIVIWDTGRASTGTLLPQDVDSLKQYLSAGNTSLWMIGGNFINDVITNVSGGMSFLGTYLKISSADLGNSANFPQNISGTAGHPVSNGTCYDISGNPVSTPLYYIEGASDTLSFHENSSKTDKKNLSISYEKNETRTRMVVSTFPFFLINSTGDQADLAYRVIKWLGNISGRVGRDVAVAQQRFSTRVVKYMDEVNISAIIRNNADMDEMNVKVMFYDNDKPIEATNISGDIFPNPYYIPLLKANGGQVDVWKWWIADSVGYHTIKVKVDPDNAIQEYNEHNNEISSSVSDMMIYVAFSILVVDDDASSPDNPGGQPSNTNILPYITGRLTELDYVYTTYIVDATGDGPNSSYMMKFNAVIWECGEASHNTLTYNDMSELSKYLTDYHGRVWLIGQNIVDDIDDTDYGRTFLKDVVGLRSWITNTSIANPLSGVRDDPISHGLSYRTVVTSGFDGSADALIPDTSKGCFGFLGDGIEIENIWLEDSVPPGASEITTPWGSPFNWTTDEVYSGRYSFVLNGSNTSRVKSGIQNQIQSTICPPTSYLSFFVKYSTKPARLNVSLQISGIGWTTVHWGGPQDSTYVDELPVEGRWNNLVVPLVRIGVDSDHQLGKGVSFELSGGNETYFDRVSIINTNASRFNAVRYHNREYDYQIVLSAFEPTFIASQMYGLRAYYKNYTGYQGKSLGQLAGDINPITGYPDTYTRIDPNIDFIWGASGPGLPSSIDDTPTVSYAVRWEGKLRFDYSEDYTFYFEATEGVNMWIDFGNDGVFDNNDYPAGDKIPLRINNIVGSVSWSLHNSFPLNSPPVTITQGWKRIRVEYFNGDGYGRVQFYWQSNHTTKQIVPMDHFDPGTGYGSGFEEQKELMYRVLRWFTLPDPRIDLSISKIDIKHTSNLDLDLLHPAIGTTYILQAQIWNHGDSLVTAPVRFWDNRNLIDTVVAVCLPQSFTTAECIWSPKYAGIRTLTVDVDAGNTVKEVFENNNRANRTIEVFYFWDDMENGPGQWTHDATLLRISGENPLDFFGNENATDMKTNVSYDWDWANSTGFYNVSFTSHTFDTCFFMPETNTIGSLKRPNLLVAIVLDSSESMTRAWGTGTAWTYTQNATKVLLNQLSDLSVVSFYSFQGTNAVKDMDWTQLTSPAGRNAVNTSLNNIQAKAGQQTSIWDAIGLAYEEVRTAASSYPNLKPVIIVLSDGADYQSNDNSSAKTQMIEAGSRTWCPWHWMYINNDTAQGYYVVPYDYHVGKYSLPFHQIPGFWFNASIGNPSKNRRGLLNCNYPIYTIGLALEHNPNIDIGVWPTTSTYPGDNVYDSNQLYVGNNPPHRESGTVEYNLWRISTTSNGGKYYYSQTPDDLANVFALVGYEIASLSLGRGLGDNIGDISRDGSRQEGYVLIPNPWDGSKDSKTGQPIQSSNGTKRLVTRPINLDGYTSATLSFYQKYNLRLGGSGAVVFVSYYDFITKRRETEYILPKTVYSSNIQVNYSFTDTLGNRVMWGYNGISDKGRFDWEYVEFDLTKFVGCHNLTINITYLFTEPGTGGGWWIDDVVVKGTRANSAGITSAVKDSWLLCNKESYSGKYSWTLANTINFATNYLPSGVDTSLYTKPIDLTNAYTATLSAKFKFNINPAAGRPPDGFRVEVSTDNGKTWSS